METNPSQLPRLQAGLGWTANIPTSPSPSDEGDFLPSLFKQLAASRDDFIKAANLSYFAEGGEHIAYLDELRKNVIKITKYTAGYTFGFSDDGTGLAAVFSTPRAYLRRIDMTNEIFEDSLKILGIIPIGAHTWAIVHSQPYYGSARPHPKAVHRYMRSLGFQRVDPEIISGFTKGSPTYYHKEKNLLAADCKPDNFRVLKSGTPMPIDVICAQPKDGMMKMVQANLFS